MSYARFFIFLALATLLHRVEALEGFSDANILSGKVRTEYPVGRGTGTDYLTLWYTNNGLSGAEGCLFDASSTTFGCPGRAGMGTAWQGTIQVASACRGNTGLIGDSWYGCLSYSSSPYFSINSPADTYWVISANLDQRWISVDRGRRIFRSPFTS